MNKKIKLLIVGAGPYGIALGLYAQQHQIDYLIVGKVMDFWENNMPSGMQLRTPLDWPNENSLTSILQNNTLNNNLEKPISRELFIATIRSSIKQKKLNITQQWVNQIDSNGSSFSVQIEKGEIITAEQVVIATGYNPYQRIPEEFSYLLPRGRYSHSSECTDFQKFQGKKCLIIGGRQGAFEWAGLIGDYAAQVDIVYRHDTPEFAPSDWSWVYPLIENTQLDPDWYRRLSQHEKEAINSRFFFEGRRQLEDWLLNKCNRNHIKTWPNTLVEQCQLMTNKELRIGLSNGESINVDHVILATGYQVDINNLAIITSGNIIEHLMINEGYPDLDTGLQSNIPGLYFTGIHAVKDFGPMFFFVACAFAAAEIIGKKIR